MGLKFGFLMGLLLGFSSLHASTVPNQNPWWMGVGLELGQIDKSGVTAPEIPKGGLHFGGRVTGFRYWDRWVADLSLGYRVDTLKGSTEDSNVVVKSRYMPLGFGGRYRFTPNWEMGLDLNLGFGSDLSFSDAELNPPGMLFSYGLKAAYLKPLGPVSMRFAASYLRDLNVSNRRISWFQGMIEVSIPLGYSQGKRQSARVKKDFSVASSKGTLKSGAKAASDSPARSSKVTIRPKPSKKRRSNFRRKSAANPVPKNVKVASRAQPKATVIPPSDNSDFEDRPSLPIPSNLIVFESGRSKIRQKSKQFLIEFAELLKHYKDNWSLLVIQGHTDSKGSRKINQKISQDRANTVRSYLEAQGVSKTKIQARGFGEDKPKNKDNTPEADSQNRRIEMTIKGLEEHKALTNELESLILQHASDS